MRKLTYLFSVVTVLTVLTTAASASALVYEGFATPGDYADATNVATQTGGGSGVWTSNWTDVQANGAGTTVTTPLTYGNLQTSAGSLTTPVTSRLHEVRTFTNDANLFAPNGTVWFSALFLRTANTSNMGITIAAGTSETIGCGFRVDNSAHDVRASINGSMGTTSANTWFDNGETVLVVGRVSIDAGANAIGDHLVDIWVNPDLSVDLSNAALRSGDSYMERAYAGFEASDRINIYSHQNNAVSFDEIRVGATFADVAPVPEPATMSLLGLGAFALLRKRTR